MSRIGKLPVPVPSGVDVQVQAVDRPRAAVGLDQPAHVETQVAGGHAGSLSRLARAADGRRRGAPGRASQAFRGR